MRKSIFDQLVFSSQLAMLSDFSATVSVTEVGATTCIGHAKRLSRISSFSYQITRTHSKVQSAVVRAFMLIHTD